MNKKGQGLSTNTIILLILGIVILVILILGFTMGWSKLNPFLSKDNVQTIVNQCESACATGDTYGFCIKTRTLNDGTNPEIKDTTCNLLSGDSYVKYGVKECPEIQPCSLSSG